MLMKITRSLIVLLSISSVQANVESLQAGGDYAIAKGDLLQAISPAAKPLRLSPWLDFEQTIPKEPFPLGMPQEDLPATAYQVNHQTLASQ